MTWWNKADDRTSFEFYNNFIDFFFVHTNFLTFSLKFADKEEATGYSRRLFYHIDTIVVERKTESWWAC